MVSYRIIDSSVYQTSGWLGGKTQELYLFPPKSDYSRRDFEFRLSTATVELEQSQFTVLPGVKRLLVTLDKPLRLRNVTQGEEIDLAPFQVYAFEGEDVITSFGQCQDFNVMWRQPYQGEIHPLTDGELMQKSAEIQFVYALVDLVFTIDEHGTGSLKAHQLLKVVQKSPNQETVLRLSSEQSSQPVLGIWIGLSSNGQ